MNDAMTRAMRHKNSSFSDLVNRLGIRQKMLGSILIVYFSTIVLASILFLSYEWDILKKQALTDLRVQAAMTGDNLTAALSFEDPRDAVAVLETLQRQPDIIRAGVFRLDGTAFASYRRDERERDFTIRAEGWTHRFTREGLEVLHDVTLEGEKIGDLYLLSNMGQARNLIVKSAFGLGALSLLGLIMAGSLSTLFQRSITRPLYHLAETAGRVTGSGDYTIRAEKYYDDEVGVLTEALNRMLEQILTGQEALKESEERFRTIFRSNPDAISICRLSDGVWMDVNEHFSAVTGYRRQDVLGRSGKEIDFWSRSEDRERFFKVLEKEGAVPDVTAEMKRKGGETYIGLISACRIDLGGQPHILSIMRDITPQKRAEEKLQSYQTQLETLVQERTAQLEEAQAELVQKERLSVLGQLTATVSHEIRNPLGTVRNAVFSISDAFGKGETLRVERALKLAERNIVRMDGIIDELLYYTRKREKFLEFTELDPWMRNVLQEQEVHEGVEVEADLSCGASIFMDREKLRRAFLNVYQNAVQAVQGSAEKTGRITVRTGQGGSGVSITVMDTGPGIGSEEIEKIFEPLFSTKSFGVGLGMPIVRNILEEHKGTIKIESTPGKGTTVTLNLPVDGGGSR